MQAFSKNCPPRIKQKAEYHGFDELEKPSRVAERWQFGVWTFLFNDEHYSRVAPDGSTAVHMLKSSPPLPTCTIQALISHLGVANGHFMGAASSLSDLLSSMFCCIEFDQRHNCNENSLQKLITTHSFNASLP